MKSKKQFCIVLTTFLFTTTAFADLLPWSTIEKNFIDQKLNSKALSHVKCFFEKHGDTVFQKTISQIGGDNRCSGNPNITLDSKRIFAIVDYTASGHDRRMFIVDRQTGEISKMAAAHGRYNASMINTHLSTNKNTLKVAKYFSNEIGSNASSSGFYVAGTEYEGKFGRSLVIHGLEKDINDKACERSTIIHPHSMVTKDMAAVMSSGCIMVSKATITNAINVLEGSNMATNEEEKYGGVVFIYGPREEKWNAETCEGNFNI
ncbi:MAG: murein L,D-transpeptidase catalytic domain family protein [Rhizobacter sp.]|nr:murein L,D-transpeptidase catalytic domain family protein [Bacteriovorax sp.]